MASAKEEMVKSFQEQPDDSSFDEINREFAFARMIERGFADSESSKVVSDEEMDRRIKVRPQ